MITIILTDGTKYVGKDAHEIIQQMKLEDWTVHETVDDYKANMNRRTMNFLGRSLTYSTDEEFLQELKRIGFIGNILLGEHK